jgi:hypothetical protein
MILATFGLGELCKLVDTGRFGMNLAFLIILVFIINYWLSWGLLFPRKLFLNIPTFVYSLWNSLPYPCPNHKVEEETIQEGKTLLPD